MKNQVETRTKGQVVIYKAKGKGPALEVTLQKETVWLSQGQISNLFGVNIPAVSKHIRNIFQRGELSPRATVSKMEIVQKEGNRSINRKVDFFNLDMIISIGYRVNSARATQFRIWATQILKKHLVDGYTIYEKRLSEQKEKFKSLQRSVEMIKQVAQRKALSPDEATAFLSLINDYSFAMGVLDDYDHALVALTLLTAESNPKDKDIIVALVVNLINRNN